MNIVYQKLTKLKYFKKIKMTDNEMHILIYMYILKYLYQNIPTYNTYINHYITYHYFLYNYKLYFKLVLIYI